MRSGPIVSIALFAAFLGAMLIAMSKPQQLENSNARIQLNFANYIQRDGSPLNIDDGNLVVIFSTSCLECKKNLAKLKAARLLPKGIIFDQNYEVDSLKNLGYSHIYTPIKREFLVDLGVRGVPETYVVDAQGNVIYTARGVLEDEDIDAIRKLYRK